MGGLPDKQEEEWLGKTRGRDLKKKRGNFGWIINTQKNKEADK